MRRTRKSLPVVFLFLICLMSCFQLPATVQASAIPISSNQPASIICLSRFSSYTTNVLVSTGYSLTFLAGESGIPLWSRNDYSFLTSLSYVIINDEIKIITQDPNKIAVLNSKTGEEQWAKDTSRSNSAIFNLTSTVAIGYIDSTTFKMVDIYTGTELWTYPFTEGRAFLKININDDIADDVLFWNNNYLLALNGVTGDVLLNTKLPWNQTYSEVELFNLDDGMILALDLIKNYFENTTDSNSSQGMIGLVNVTTGLPIWSSILNISVQDVAVGNLITSNSSEIVLLGTDLSSNLPGIFTLNVSDGQFLGNFTLSEATSDFVLADLNSDGLDEIACIGSSLIVFSKGEISWSRSVYGTEITTGYINFDKRPDLVVRSQNGTIAAFSGLSGLLLWKARIEPNPYYSYTTEYYTTAYPVPPPSPSYYYSLGPFLVLGIVIVMAICSIPILIVLFIIFLTRPRRPYKPSYAKSSYQPSYQQPPNRSLRPYSPSYTKINHQARKIESPYSPPSEYKPSYTNVKAGPRTYSPPPVKFTSPKTKTCPECFTDLYEDSRYCHVCGSKVEKQTTLCPKCGTHIESTYKFCSMCGYKL
ncbi:MAG: PQQ-binding-like beta-propeller repeat protein [Candidatus Hodarchaeota archaeon]